MYPTQPLNTSPQTFSPRIRLLLLLIAVVIFVIVGTTIQTSPRLSVNKLSVHPRNKAQIIGGSLYEFNGIAFQKSDASGKISLLSKPVRWPDFGQITWLGDRGAIVTVANSIYGTPFENLSQQYNLYDYSYSELEQKFLWYINFSDNSVSLVSESDAGVRIVSNSKEGVGYIAEQITLNESDGAEATVKIIKYTPSSREPLEYSVPLSHVTTMAPCTEADVCLTGTREGKNILLGFKDGQFKSVFESENKIINTNLPNIFTSLATKNITTLGEADDYSEPLNDFSVEAVDIADSNKVIARQNISSANDVIPILDERRISSLVINTDHLTTVSKVRTLFGLHKTTTVKHSFSLSPITPLVYDFSRKNAGLIQDISGSYYYVGYSRVKYPSTQVIDMIIASCTAGRNILHEPVDNFHSLVISETETTPTSMAEALACITKDPSQLAGHHFAIDITAYSGGPIVSN